MSRLQKKGSTTDQNVQAGDLCKINCMRGYKSNGYTEITCLAVKNVRTGAIEGVWSEKRKVDCVLKELYIFGNKSVNLEHFRKNAKEHRTQHF